MYGFNMKYNSIIAGEDGIESNERWQVNLIRNKVLLTGNASVVEQFYKEWFGFFKESKYELMSRSNSFWHNIQPHNARVFFGLVKMINDAFVRLITSGGIDVKVREEGKTYEGENDFDEELTQKLEKILEFNKFQDKKWAMAESYQSGLGFVPLRIAIDEDISDKPILEVIRPERIEVLDRRGVVYGYIFKRRQTVYDIEYEVQEIHFREDNKPQVQYKVLQVGQLSEEIAIETMDSDLYEALGLEHVLENERDPYITLYQNMSDMPVVLKNNTGYNSAFPQCPFGEADTQGLETIEDALSELLSSMVEEIRKGKIKVLISEDLVPKDRTGKSTKFNDFKLDYEIIGKDEGDNKNLIEIVQGEINSEKYIAGVSNLIAYGCNKSNIHPITVGITGVESIDASQESQVEREKVSLRTRESKLNSWRKALQRLFKLLLEAQDIMEGVDPKQYEVKVEFGMFENPSRQSIVDVLSKAVQGNVISTLDAMTEFHGNEKSEDEVYMEYIRWKLEKNLPLAQSEQQFYEKRTGESLATEEVE